MFTAQAVAREACSGAVDKPGECIAMPILQPVARCGSLSAMALVGQDCQLVHELRMPRPADWDSVARVERILMVQPDDYLVEPDPQVCSLAGRH
ncbi:hypothetical protein ASD11_14540 [Aeromicrobium sp. Root495]|nr:hypothetical protein ASD11_14540 [Aeromicrobium sp. Root495]